MKFLFKKSDSEILKENLVYSSTSHKQNQRIKELLIEEQKNFCAYTEEFITSTISIEVEHFNPSIKFKDDYFNYYSVNRNANLLKRKKENQPIFKIDAQNQSGFFESKFFQNKTTFENRIEYNKNECMYFTKSENDTEASSLIDYLSFNHPLLVEDRKKHLKRLRETITMFANNTERIEYFKKHKSELKFITAIEKEFSLDLTGII